MNCKKMTLFLSCAVLFSSACISKSAELCIREENCAERWCRNKANVDMESCVEEYEKNYSSCLEEADQIDERFSSYCLELYRSTVHCLYENTSCGESKFEYTLQLAELSNSGICKEKVYRYNTECVK